MIFETERLEVRLLVVSDVESYFELQGDPEVLKYAIGDAMSYEESKKDLEEVIKKYSIRENDFWIFAIERKIDNQFIGTIAYIKEANGDDEIGYRFIKAFWGNGYGLEVCKGMIEYAKKIKLPKLIGYVVDENIASAKILTQLGFVEIDKMVDKETGLPETKYELIL